MTAGPGSVDQVKPEDLASGARRTEKWNKETHVTTIKRGGGHVTKKLIKRGGGHDLKREHTKTKHATYLYGHCHIVRVHCLEPEVTTMTIRRGNLSLMWL